MYELEEEQEDPIETLHIYVYPEEVQAPRRSLSPPTKDTILGIGTLILLLAGVIALCLIPNEPAYAIQTVSVPAHFLPLAQFVATTPIHPTGTRTYPATSAQGRLTIYNGSILTQELPAGFLVTSNTGIEVVMDTAVTIPAGNPPAYGIATVAAHAVAPGFIGNIRVHAVDITYGTSLFLKNLAAFTGGQDARTETYATSEDIQQALARTRAALALQERQHAGLLGSPCQEQTAQQSFVLSVSWACQFVTFTPPPGVQVVSARVVGNRVFVRVKVVTISSRKGWPSK